MFGLIWADGVLTSSVWVVPDVVAVAASRVAEVGSAVDAAGAVAAVPTSAVVAAAGDEVSAAVAVLFGQLGLEYQQVSVQAGVFHERFVAALTAAGTAYGVAEAANVSPLQTLERDILGVINAPTEWLLVGR